MKRSERAASKLRCNQQRRVITPPLSLATARLAARYFVVKQGDSPEKLAGRYSDIRLVTRAQFGAQLYKDCDDCRELTQIAFLCYLDKLPKQAITRPSAAWYVGVKETDCLTKDLYRYEHGYEKRKPRHGNSFPNCCLAAKLAAWEAMADCPDIYMYPDGSRLRVNRAARKAKERRLDGEYLVKDAADTFGYGSATHNAVAKRERELVNA